MPLRRHHAAATAVLAAAARCLAAAGARAEVLGAHGKSPDATPPFSVVPRCEPTVPSGTRLREQVAQRSPTGGSGRVPRQACVSRVDRYSVCEWLLVLPVQAGRALACGSARSPPLWVGRDSTGTRIWAAYVPQLFQGILTGTGCPPRQRRRPSLGLGSGQSSALAPRETPCLPTPLLGGKGVAAHVFLLWRSVSENP